MELQNPIWEYVDEIYILKRDKKYDKAIELLTNIIDHMESNHSEPVAPYYYEQLAIVYHKLGEREKELEILERFSKQKHAPGALVPKLLERLEKLKYTKS